MLESSATELNNKKISIGWKLHESEMPGNNTAQPISTSSQPVSTSTRLVGVPAGSRPPTYNRNVGPSQNNIPSQTNTIKQPQSIWTTHTIIF